MNVLQLTPVRDPRPDLAADSPAWSDLLLHAWALDHVDPEGLFGALDGLRCLGASLVVRSAGGMRVSNGRIPMAEYAELREKWLRPRADRLIALLDGMEAQA